MKGFIIIILIVFIPFLGEAGSCYGDWHYCYNDAEASYASNRSYCSSRGFDTKYLQCFKLAKADFGDAIEGCAETYERCVVDL